jgi:hypothetical protein
LSGNATLTLNGSSSSYFLINVKKDFSLSSSYVKLSGGITWDHVLVNVRGSGATSMSGTSEFNGILLAPGRDLSMSGDSKLLGAAIVNTVNMSGNSIIRCPNVSP